MVLDTTFEVLENLSLPEFRCVLEGGWVIGCSRRGHHSLGRCLTAGRGHGSLGRRLTTGRGHRSLGRCLMTGHGGLVGCSMTCRGRCLTIGR